jgi:hypothetical protein
MSVLVTIVFNGDSAAAERYAAENPGALAEIVEDAAEHGLIAHRFYGEDGQIFMLDEWPDAESFQAFFTHMQPQIQPFLEAVGASGVVKTSRPVFWRKLETGDDYGWGA